MSDREPQEPQTGPWYCRRSFPDGKRWTITYGEGDSDIAAVIDHEPTARQIVRLANRAITEARAAERDSTPGAASVRALVNEQAEDEGLWFIARTAPEGYLQQELRRLHAAIERDSGREAREVLRIYGRHLKGCCVTVSPVPANCCDCGFLRALAAVPRPEGTDGQ